MKNKFAQEDIWDCSRPVKSFSFTQFSGTQILETKVFNFVLLIYKDAQDFLFCKSSVPLFLICLLPKT